MGPSASCPEAWQPRLVPVRESWQREAGHRGAPWWDRPGWFLLVTQQLCHKCDRQVWVVLHKVGETCLGMMLSQPPAPGFCSPQPFGMLSASLVRGITIAEMSW